YSQQHKDVAGTAADYVEDARCRWTYNNAKHDTDATVRDFLVGSELTLLTVGVGSFAGGVRFAAAGFSEATSAVKAASLAIALMDAGQAAKGVYDAYQGCGKVLN